jgi:predicted dehydrogenase
MKQADKNTQGMGACLTRRGFLGRTAGAATGAMVAAMGFPTIIPSSAMGADGTVAPSNRVVVGFIGVGPQGQGVMANYLRRKDCQVVAVCDVKTDMLNQARDRVNGQYQNKDCAAYHDFQEITGRPDIDACHIATPDHWHVLTSLAAVRNKKDVYCEKPLSLAVEEGRILRAEVNKYQRVFQFGTQQRSSHDFWQACSLARNGHLGKLKSINVWCPGSTPGGSAKMVPPPATLDYDRWLGQAPVTPYTEDRCTDDGAKKTWWFNSDYTAGFITGWGIHPMDIAQWGASDLSQGTVEVGGKAIYGDTVACNTPRVWDIDFKFSSGLALKFVGLPNGGNQDRPTGDPVYHHEDWKKRYRRASATHGTAFEGEAGWVHVDRSGLNCEPETLRRVKKEDFKVHLTESYDHVGNFLECVRSRAKTVCPIEEAVLADTLCQIADIAARLGRTLTYDFGREDFVNDAEASRRLRLREMRKPWGIA